MASIEKRQKSNTVWEFFASVKLSIFLLLTLAATSIVGTIIPQNENPAAYIRQYGEPAYRLMSYLGIFDMYRSWWFSLLLLMLAANLVICSLNRFPGTWKIATRKVKRFSENKMNSIRHKEEFVTVLDPDKLEPVTKKLFGKRFAHVITQPGTHGFSLYAEKGRWTRLGAYIIHVGFLLILFGGIVGSIWGFSGHVNINEGETTDTIFLRNTNEPKQLPFAVTCKDFDVSFYETGAPKEFRSTLTIVEHGKDSFTQDVIVNAPLRYKGINLFQSSYGSNAAKDVVIMFQNRATKMTFSVPAVIGEKAILPEGRGEFVVLGFRNNFRTRGHNIGPVFFLEVFPHEGESFQTMIPVEYPRFDAMRKGELIISVADYTPVHYTGLQVTSDPGVGIVYSGFVFLILGCFVTFFLSHQQVYLHARKKGKQTRVVLAGTATKNRQGFVQRTNAIATLLQNAADKVAKTKSI